MLGILGLISALLLVSEAAPEMPEMKAPKDRADMLVREGARLGEAGEYERAIAHFKEAEAIFSRAIHDCNMGLAYARWGKLGQAQAFLDRCRSRAVEALPAWVDNRAKMVMDALRDGPYAPVEIVVDLVGATIHVSAFADDELFGAPRVVWLPFGEQMIVISVPGRGSQQRTLTIDSNEGRRLSVVFAPEDDSTSGETEHVDAAEYDVKPTEAAEELAPIDASDELADDATATATEPPPIDLVSVTIRSQPSQADVLLEGQHVGQTEYHTQLVPGRYQVTLRKAGYEPHSTTFAAALGTDTDLSLDLTAEPVSPAVLRWSLTGVAVAALTVWVWQGVQAISLDRRAESLYGSDPRAASAARASVTAATIADVAMISTLVSGGVAIWLWAMEL